jgi:hypothetical protein
LDRGLVLILPHLAHAAVDGGDSFRRRTRVRRPRGTTSGKQRGEQRITNHQREQTGFHASKDHLDAADDKPGVIAAWPGVDTTTLPAVGCWQTIAQDIIGAGGVVTIDDPAGTTSQHRFYRLMLGP